MLYCRLRRDSVHPFQDFERAARIVADPRSLPEADLRILAPALREPGELPATLGHLGFDLCGHVADPLA